MRGTPTAPTSAPRRSPSVTAVLDKLDVVTAKRVRVLFLSVDPQLDSLAVLGRYVRVFNSRFTGLRLTGNALNAFEARYGICVSYGKPDAQGG